MELFTPFDPQLPSTTDWHNDDIRLCHAGGVHIPFIDALVQDIAALLNTTIDWDTETLGCFGLPDDVPAGPHEWHIRMGFQTLADWLDAPQNANETLVIMHDDQMDLGTWGKVGDLTLNVSDYFGSQVFTQADKASLFPDQGPNAPNFPTPRQMVKLGKRIIFTSGSDYGSEMYPWIFYKYGSYPTNFANWSEFSPDAVGPFPTCAMEGFTLNQGFIARVLGDAIIYGPSNSTDDGEIDGPRLGQLVRCGVNFPCMDEVIPSMLQGGLWTWDPSENVTTIETQPRFSSGLCPAAATGTGLWHLARCSAPTAAYACGNPAAASVSVTNEFGTLMDSTDWKVSASLGPWTPKTTACPAGYVFAAPSSPRAAEYLRLAIPSSTPLVWVNYVPGS